MMGPIFIYQRKKFETYYFLHPPKSDSSHRCEDFVHLVLMEKKRSHRYFKPCFKKPLIFAAFFTFEGIWKQNCGSMEFLSMFKLNSFGMCLAIQERLKMELWMPTRLQNTKQWCKAYSLCGMRERRYTMILPNFTNGLFTIARVKSSRLC